MKNQKHKVGFLLLTLLFSVAGCIAQKTLGVTFTESGKGAGIQSGLVEKTAVAAPANILSTTDALNEAVTLLEFVVKENGSRDGYPLQIKEMRFSTSGTADIADLRFVLDGPGLNNAFGVAKGTQIIFKNYGDIIVSDGDLTGKTYQIKVHLRDEIKGNLADNSNFAIQISPVTDMDVTETSSNLLLNVPSMQTTSSTVLVTATQLQGKGTFNFGSIAANTNFPGTPAVSATDINGRIDLNFTNNIQIEARDTSFNCAGPGSGALVNPSGGCNLDCAAVQGVATWPQLRFNTAATSFKVYAISGAMTFCSSAITVP